MTINCRPFIHAVLLLGKCLAVCVPLITTSCSFTFCGERVPSYPGKPRPINSTARLWAEASPMLWGEQKNIQYLGSCDITSIDGVPIPVYSSKRLTFCRNAVPEVLPGAHHVVVTYGRRGGSDIYASNIMSTYPIYLNWNAKAGAEYVLKLRTHAESYSASIEEIKDPVQIEKCRVQLQNALRFPMSNDEVLFPR